MCIIRDIACLNWIYVYIYFTQFHISPSVCSDIYDAWMWSDTLMKVFEYIFQDRMTYIVDYAKMKNTLPHLQQQTSSEFNCSRCNRSEFMQICSDDVLMKDLFSGGVIPSGPNWYPVKATQTSDISAMATSHELFSTKSRDGARVPVVSYYKLINSSVGVFAPCYIWCPSMEVFKVNVVTMLQYILKATTPGSTVVLLFQYKNLDTVALKDFFFPAYGTSYISKVLSDLGACTVETPLEERVGTSKLWSYIPQYYLNSLSAQAIWVRFKCAESTMAVVRA